MLFVDTSAFFALLDRADEQHELAVTFADSQREGLVSHNYVVLETASLVQRRLGARALRAFLQDTLGPIEIVWVDEELHATAVAAQLSAPAAQPSLVDWTSFTVMRARSIATAFAFDRHFRRQGFETVP